MAGTMPHAIFIETNADGAGGVAAYAAELPGCAVFAPTDDEAANAMPRRVERFSAWLRAGGEPAPGFLGDNWYEVEREAAVEEDGELRRAHFSLDELSPSDTEFEHWQRWMELAREELAAAVDDANEERLPGLLGPIVRQDLHLARALGGDVGEPRGDLVDRLYAARDALTDALQAAGPDAEGVRRAVRLAIADDLRAAEGLREGTG